MYTPSIGVPKLGFVFHGTLGSYAGAVEWLSTDKRVANPSSAHYIIGKNKGQVTQLVRNSDIAWGAGTVRNPLPWADKLLLKNAGVYVNPNKYLIHIEFEWFVGDQLTDFQYECALQIIKDSGIKNPIIVDHHSICDYKTDNIYFGVVAVNKILTTPVKPTPTTTAKFGNTPVQIPPMQMPRNNFTVAMEYGQRSPDICFLQYVLQYEGCLDRAYNVQGVYDDKTAAGVKLLQSKHQIASVADINLLAGKRAGPLTIKYLNKTYGY